MRFFVNRVEAENGFLQGAVPPTYRIFHVMLYIQWINVVSGLRALRQQVKFSRSFESAMADTKYVDFFAFDNKLAVKGSR